MSKDKEDFRPHVKYLRVEDNTLVGTNGGRLHAYKLERELPDGWYKALESTKRYAAIYHDVSIQGDYPKWQDLLPDPESIDWTKAFFIDPDKALDAAVYKINTKLDKCVNIGFVKDLGASFQVDINSDDRIYAESGNLQAIIMPMVQPSM